MNKIKDLISFLKEKWSVPSKANHKGELTFFSLSCSFNSHGVRLEKNFPYVVPQDLQEFWNITESAELFKDNEYDQWGLEIFSPDRALIETKRQLEERPEDYKPSDLVIGSFIGDSDLLVISCDSEREAFGQVHVALPIDERSNWSVVAKNFNSFLETYILKEGDKYWEL